MWVVRRELKEVEIIPAEIEGVGGANDTRVSGKYIRFAVAIHNLGLGRIQLREYLAIGE